MSVRSTAILMSATLLLTACGGPRNHVRDWPDGAPQQRGQLDGYRPVGAWTTYHANGRLQSQGEFVAGRQHGRWTYGHPDGAAAGVGHWSNGVQHGWWTSRTPEGHLVSAGLMLRGRRVGPWLQDGILRVHGEPAPSAGVDTISWQSLGAGSVSWLVSDTLADIEAYWDGPGSPWHERLADAQARDLLATGLAGRPTTAPQAPPAAAVPAELEPAPQAVELTPVPPLITYGPIIKSLAGFLRDGFEGTIATANDPPRPVPAAAGDPRGRQLVGRSLPQTRFLASTGGIIDLAAPERTTVLVIMRGFSGSICLYCASQTAALADAASAFAQAGIDVVIAFPGPASTVPAFLDAVRQLRDEPPPFPVALDVNQLLVQGLGIEADLAMPTSLVVRRDGTVGWAYVGSSMSDRPDVAVLLDAARAQP